VKAKKVVRKRRPKGSGRHPLTAARLPPSLVSQVDRYARENKTSRSDAIKQLLEQALANLKP
jgi:Ribbon-helix-helix protein, copG family